MSTTDPRIARAEREQRAQRSGLRVGITIVLALVHAALWALAGYGFGLLYDSMRLMGINQVGDGWDSRFGDGLPILFIVGIAAGSILGFLLTGSAGRMLGLASGMLLPLFTGTAGIAIGLALFRPEWTPPQSYGEMLGFLPGDPAEPWDGGAWLQYWLPTWLPLLFAGISLLLLIAVVATALAARRKGVRMAQAMQTGRKARGTVTEVRETGSEINGMPYVVFTVRFRDLAGTDRWVTKKSTLARASVPREGDPALVWFDPADPGTQKKIVVGLGPEAASTPV